jgi:D-alanine-D-alanine ligase
MGEQLKVAVLMGGTSFERDFSLASGRNIVQALESAGHTVLPLDTSPTLVSTLREQKPDVVYSALHGSNGEDGTIQALLEYLHIPYVGQRPSVCRLAWVKAVLPHIVLSYRRASTGDTTGPATWPEYLALNAASFKDMGAATALDLIPEWFASGYPLAVKPMRGGSAMGVARVDDVSQMAAALLDALSFDDEVFIEEWIQGTELAVAVVGTGDKARALPPVEIAPRTGFFSTEARLNSDMVEYYCPPRPASLLHDPRASARSGEKAILEQIAAAALEVHRAFDCRDLSRIDLVWDGENPRVLEINTSPGMTEYSLVPMACAAAGLPLASLLEELLHEAIAR